MFHAHETGKAHDPSEPLEYVRLVLRSYLDRCFQGEVPEGASDEVCLNRVARALCADRPLRASDVVQWTHPMQRALYEMLAAAIVELRISPPAFTPGFLAGSSPAALGGAIARWVADKRDSPLIYSRVVR